MSRKNSKEENLMTTGNKAGYIYLQKQKDFYISEVGSLSIQEYLTEEGIYC